MPKAKKQKNGKWRCQLYIDGHNYSFTASTKADAEFMALEHKRIHGHSAVPALTLSEAIDRYLENKSNILSPATIRGYKIAKRNTIADILDTPIRKLSSSFLQVWVNEKSLTYSPKTIRNAYGLITAAVSYAYPSFRVTVSLPKKRRALKYIPTSAEVTMLIDACDKDNLRKAIMCAAYGSLRRGEICALEAGDISDGWISVTKDMVMTEDKDYVVKDMPKTDESFRRVPVPSFVTDELRNGLVTCTPHAISCAFSKLVKKVGLPHMCFHDLRHFFASYLHLKGIPDAYIEKYGGWKPGSGVMREIYRNTINSEELAQAEKIVSLFSHPSESSGEASG